MAECYIYTPGGTVAPTFRPCLLPFDLLPPAAASLHDIVHVDLPLANYPTLTSFDVNLAALLRSKTELIDSVVVPGKVEDEMMDRMGILDAK